MGSLVDYDVHYRKGPDQCGQPFPEIVQFFENWSVAKGTGLDLGCGQGRDALVAARRGHHVVGVDLSKVGLEQLRLQADRERLSIEVHCADVVEFRTRRRFDVVILDRVLHLLPTDQERRQALENACRHARKHGVILIVDDPKHSNLIGGYFDERPEWDAFKRSKQFLFAHRP